MALCNHLLLGLTGSVSVLLMPYNIFFLRRQFTAEVEVIMTHTAQQFVTPYAISVCSGNETFTHSTQFSPATRVPHIELTAKTDLFLIMPATANILAKAAHGICNDLISTAVACCQAPVVFVPSMNERLWCSRVVQRNVEMVKSLGHHVVEPTQGHEIANMAPTLGAMPPIEIVLFKLNEIIHAAA